MTWLQVWLWLAYASLAFELLFLAVPSEASTWQILRANAASASPALAVVRARSRLARLAFYALPTAIGIVLFAVPLVASLWPPVLRWLWPLSWLAHEPVAVLGLLIATLGRAIALTAVVQLRRKRGSELAVAELAPKGLFAWSRNPGLVGMFTFYIGLCLVTPCAVLAAGFVLYAVNMHRRVLIEEDSLRSLLGTPFVEYCHRVPRYLGITSAPR